MNELEMMKIQIESLRSMYKTNLIRHIKGLIQTLEIELELLEKSSNYTPNGCGIIQNAGKVIDNYCVQLGTLDMIKEESDII